jgi:hypothetical protein
MGLRGKIEAVLQSFPVTHFSESRADYLGLSTFATLALLRKYPDSASLPTWLIRWLFGLQ